MRLEHLYWTFKDTKIQLRIFDTLMETFCRAEGAGDFCLYLLYQELYKYLQQNIIMHIGSDMQIL